MPSTRTALAAALAAATALLAVPFATAPLHAQNGRIAVGASRVPPGHLPPAGLCRVWYDGVPPGRQPAPVDCDVAERQAARGGRAASVVYGAGARRGDDRRDRDGRWERDDRDGGRYDPRYPDGRDDPRYPNGRYDPRYDPRYPGGRDGEGRNRAGERPDPRRDGRYDGRYGGVHDGRYDPRYDDRAGRRLPVMPAITVLRRGSGESAAWLGRGDYRARWTDADRNGRPEQVWWMDARGTVVQLWTDTNRDGRADRVTLYQNGRPVRAVD